MKNISKFQVDKFILIPLICFAIISLMTLFGASSILSSALDNVVLKQSLWYIFGFILAYLVMTIGNQAIFRSAWILYFIGVTLYSHY